MKKVLGWSVVILLAVGWVKYSLLSQASDCTKNAEKVRTVIAAAQTCSSDEECTYIGLGCPFDCITPMRKGTRSEILAAIGEYHNSCMPMCPDCPKESPATVHCVEQKCQAVF